MNKRLQFKNNDSIISGSTGKTLPCQRIWHNNFDKNEMLKKKIPILGEIPYFNYTGAKNDSFDPYQHSLSTLKNKKMSYSPVINKRRSGMAMGREQKFLGIQIQNLDSEESKKSQSEDSKSEHEDTFFFQKRPPAISMKPTMNLVPRFKKKFIEQPDTLSYASDHSGRSSIKDAYLTSTPYENFKRKSSIEKKVAMKRMSTVSNLSSLNILKPITPLSSKKSPQIVRKKIVAKKESPKTLHLKLEHLTKKLALQKKSKKELNGTLLD
ncbi:unnamed protein product [Moneuplotes crassus]|uniref:Uncharacterized protein n=1 Tax=Euplotes crassus TaxID=5936 RepID=A0AAD1YBE2_EUPCR|nr:unnamed protein product [Moneuplotes crassus]